MNSNVDQSPRNIVIYNDETKNEEKDAVDEHRSIACSYCAVEMEFKKLHIHHDTCK